MWFHLEVRRWIERSTMIAIVLTKRSIHDLNFLFLQINHKMVNYIIYRGDFNLTRSSITMRKHAAYFLCNYIHFLSLSLSSNVTALINYIFKKKKMHGRPMQTRKWVWENSKVYVNTSRRRVFTYKDFQILPNSLECTCLHQLWRHNRVSIACMAWILCSQTPLILHSQTPLISCIARRH